MYKLSILAAIVVLSGCASTHGRPMNKSEQTVLSDAVAKLVAEDKDGVVDIREHKDIRCKRFKRVGSHMVMRHCYTVGEEEESVAETRDKMRDRFGKLSCVDRTLGGVCSNADANSPFAQLPGRNPNGLN